MQLADFPMPIFNNAFKFLTRTDNLEKLSETGEKKLT